MKKIFMVLMALCMMAPIANAELSKSEQKKIEKLAKAKAKDFEKRGFTVMGTLPMKEALVNHFTARQEGASEQLGYGTAKSKNNGRQMCLTYAMSEYSTKCISDIKGRSFTDSYGDEVDTEHDAEFARFYAAYERITQSQIKGDLKESFTVYKENSDGSYDFEMYMLYDENTASTKRQQALIDAAEESKLAQIYADQISNYISKK